LLLFFKKEALSCLPKQKQESKRFFFEKKKQKTFVRLECGGLCDKGR
jgi:hypothetical protein